MYGTQKPYESVNSFKIITHIEQVSEFIRLWAVDDSEIRTSPQGPQQDASPHKLSARVEACLNQLSPLLIRTLPPDPNRLVAGSVCFAIIDARLHRARLLSSPKSDLSRVVVLLIDYGYEATLSYSDLRSHDSDILNCPPLATPYYLDCFKLLRSLTYEELNELKKKFSYKKKLVRTKTTDECVAYIDIITDFAVTLSEYLASENLGYKISDSEMRRTLQGSAAPSSAPSPMQASQDNGASIENRLATSQPARNLAQSRLYKFQSHPTHPSSNGGMAPLSIQPTNYSIPPPSQPPGFITASPYHATNLLTLGHSSMPAFRQAPQHPSPQQTYQESKVKENCTSSVVLAIGSSHEAYVTAVNDGPYQFTIQLKTDLEETLPRLKQVLARHQPVAVTAPLIPGSMVMGQSNDKTFRRAVVSKVESDCCVLYYVDYGTTETLPSNLIFKLQPEASQYAAALGLQFRLSGLKSMKITDKDKEYFKRVVLNKRAVIVVKDSDVGASVLCQYCDMFVDGENVREALENWKTPLYFAPQYPPPEREMRITVSYVDSPTTFFVQYDSELNVLQAIQSAVQKHCNAQSPIVDKNEVAIGSAVASLYSEDGAWYRSMVVDISNDFYTVFYVDYGNRCDVQLNEIRRLNRDLVTKWRSQAVECCLVGFDTLRPDLKTAEVMEQAALGKFFTMKLYAILNGRRLKVDLIDQNGGSIADFMKKEYDRLMTSVKSNEPPVADVSKPADSFDRNKKDFGGDEVCASSGSESGGVNNKGGKSTFQENRYQRPSERAGRDRQPPPPSSNRRNMYSEHDDRTYEDYNGSEGVKTGEDNTGGGSYGRRPYGSRGADSHDTGGGGGGRPQYGGRGNRDGNEEGVGYRSKFSDNRGSRFSHDSADRPPRGGGRYNNDGGNDYSNNKFGGGGRRDFGDRRSGDDRGDRRGGNKGGFDGNDNSYQRKPRFDNNRDRDFGASSAPSTSNNESSWDSAGGGGSSGGGGWDDTPAADSVPSASTATHPEVKEFPKREIDGSEYSVLLAQLEAPDVAYVQMADCEPILLDIRAEIDADSGALSRPCSNIRKGSPVLALFDCDGLLYRAVVRDSVKPEVLYVDYGNSAVVSKTQIFEITPKLAEKPPQAIRVVLSDTIGPPAGATEWPAFESETYDTHYGVETLVLCVKKLKIIDNELVVYGLLKRSDGVDVATALVENGLASFVSKAGQIVPSTQDKVALPSDTTAAQESCPSENAIQVEVKRASPIDSLDLLKGQYLYAQLEYKFKFDDLLKLKLKEAENKLVLAKCANCDIEAGSDVITYVQDVKNGILLVKLYDVNGVSSEGQISPLCPAPVFRRKEKAYLSSIEGPIVYFQKVSDQGRLTTLTNEIFEFYETCLEGNKPKWSPGEICCAKSYDGNWYRAEIVDGPDVTVRYLDFGNIETVNVECVRELDMRFTNQSAIAVMASMPITWKTEDVGPMMDGQVLEAFMIFEDDMWLVDFKLPDGTRFVDMLDKRKFALKHADDSFEKTRLPSSWQFTSGSSVQVVIAHVDSPDLFWVHLTSDVPDIDALQEALNDVAEEGPLGKIFAAKYSDDAWYRAVNEGEEKVRFIDYGNCDVPLEKRPLKCDKLKRPEQGYAVKLRLCARPIYGGQWCEDAVNVFEGFIENEKIEAVVLKSDVEIVVDLKSGGELLSEKLIRLGYAVHFDYENPLIRSPCRAFISDIVSLNSFHLQEETVTDDLESLRENFTDAENFTGIDEVKLNQMVAAKFPDDDLWYRAIITSVEPDSSTKRAYFLDFGNSSDVTEVRKLPENLAVVPPCSIHCSLHVAEKLNTQTQRDKLEEFGGCGGTVVNAFFRDEKTPRWTVVETEEGTNVYDCLDMEDAQNGTAGCDEPEKGDDSKLDNSPEHKDSSFDEKTENPPSEMENNVEASEEAEKSVESAEVTENSVEAVEVTETVVLATEEAEKSVEAAAETEKSVDTTEEAEKSFEAAVETKKIEAPVVTEKSVEAAEETIKHVEVAKEAPTAEAEKSVIEAVLTTKDVQEQAEHATVKTEKEVTVPAEVAADKKGEIHSTEIIRAIQKPAPAEKQNKDLNAEIPISVPHSSNSVESIEKIEDNVGEEAPVSVIQNSVLQPSSEDAEDNVNKQVPAPVTSGVETVHGGASGANVEKHVSAENETACGEPQVPAIVKMKEQPLNKTDTADELIKNIGDEAAEEIVSHEKSKMSEETNIFLKKGQCKVTLINSSEDMYIQDLEKASNLEQFAKRLKEDAPILVEPKPGDHGFVIHESVPKRCSITSTDPPSVFFYDYGTTSTQITLSDIRTLPDDVSSIEPLAILCSLGYGLTPTETDKLKSLFNSEATSDYELDLMPTPPIITLAMGGVDVRNKLIDVAKPSESSSSSSDTTPLPAFQMKREPLPVKTVEQMRAEAKSRIFDKSSRMSPSLARRQSLDLDDKLLPGCVTGIAQ